MHFASRLFSNSKRSFRKRRFLDSLRLFVKAGSGGMGYPKIGGVGGAGGDIYVIGKEGITLKNVVEKFPMKRIVAESGENAHQRNVIGYKGKDTIVEAPIGIVLYDQTGKELGAINKDGEKVKIATGGLGGRPETSFSGIKGEAHTVVFDLKLIADVGLVGFPNAGKSTILSKISQAKPKIASYPFTTIQPQLGTIVYDDGRYITVADLPGLIEGAHINIGMGHKFLKHIERTKLLLVVVDVTGFQLSVKYQHRSCLETIILLNKELELYRQELLNYPSILILNKMDKEGSKAIYETVYEDVQNLEDVVKDIPEKIRPAQPFKFKQIIGLSAQNGDQREINDLKRMIRKLLDEDIDQQVINQEEIIISYFNKVLKEKGPKVV